MAQDPDASVVGGDPAPTPPRPPKLLERMRQHLRTRHYSIRTEEAYIDWARRFILFHDKRHPQDMGAAEVGVFLTHLAVDRQVSASTQNQAKAALLYLYKQVLGVDLPWLDEVVQAKRPRRLPVVLTPSEVRTLLQHMDGTTGLIAELLYGTGMRLLEGLRLRVKDIEFARREIVVREGKGGKDRVTVLPANLIAPLQAQLHKARALHEKDLAAGLGRVYLPHTLAVKYPRRRPHLGLAVGVSVPGAGHRPAPGCAHRPAAGAAPPCVPRVGATRGARGGARGADCQAGVAACAAPFVCHASAAGGL